MFQGHRCLNPINCVDSVELTKQVCVCDRMSDKSSKSNTKVCLKGINLNNKRCIYVYYRTLYLRLFFIRNNQKVQPLNNITRKMFTFYFR